MASTGPDERLTAEEFARLEVADRAELVDGVVVMDEDSGITTGAHGYISLSIGAALRAWGRKRGRAFVETGFALARDPDLVRRPDVSFVFAERLEGRNLLEAPLELAPDLAVEVLSPSDTQQRITDKLDDYLRAGVRLVWLVNPLQRYVVTHAPDAPPRLVPAGAVLDGGDVLPGFEVPVDEVFE